MTEMLLGRPPGAAFRPVKNGNAFEQTVERLMQAIKLGMVSQGERLPPERELAEDHPRDSRPCHGGYPGCALLRQFRADDGWYPFE